MAQAKSYTPYEKIIGSASSLLIDLFCQLGNLTLTLQREQQRKEVGTLRQGEQGKDVERETASPVFERALKTAITNLQFSLLEAISNALAQITIKTNEKIKGAPKTKITLSQVEVDLLAEQRSYFDPRTGSLKINEPAFVSTLDKLAIAPVLFGKLDGYEFRLDKRAHGWQKIKQLKESKDKLVHFQVDDEFQISETVFQPEIGKAKAAFLIKNTDIFEGSEGIRWYIQQLIGMLEHISKSRHSRLINILFAAEYTNWMVLLNFHKSCGISEKAFSRDYPPPVSRKLTEEKDD